MTEKHFHPNWTDQQIAMLVSLFHAFVDALPELLSLTSNERQASNPISDGRFPYANKCRSGVKEHYVALGMTPDEAAAFEELAYTWEKLVMLRNLVGELSVALRDTTTFVGSRYYTECGIVHDSARLAVKKGKPGIRAFLEDLDKLFADQGNHGGNDENGPDDDAPSDDKG